MKQTATLLIAALLLSGCVGSALVLTTQAVTAAKAARDVYCEGTTEGQKTTVRNTLTEGQKVLRCPVK